MTASSTIKNYCIKCLNETNQKILFKEEESHEYPEEDTYFSYTYYVLKCAGCEKVTYRTDYDDKDNIDYDEHGTMSNYTEIKTFPPTIKNHRPLDHTYLLPGKIKTLYQECTNCIAANSKIMAAAAFRAIVEGVCAEESVKGKDLKAKITALAKDGLISKKDATRLHSIRFMGNDALHKIEPANDEKILLVLQIVEHLLSSLYIIESKAKEHLETTIEDYEDFKKILRRCVRESALSGEQPLRLLLTGSYRRVEDNIVEFEKQLIAEIKKGKFPMLTHNGKKHHVKFNNCDHYTIIPK